MGQHAEDITDGLVCQTCGEFIDGEAPGYPRTCEECAPKRRKGGAT